ncbi:hypothetical protein [Paenibacillus ginsengihumi]|uniref:hypothetical protein n=1 Tax=Paenibacillus ginsengihumi TaxID=431596 RepID=UPI0003684441|nr:hypothetical protein [Paenibacillus ginsengihumi]
MGANKHVYILLTDTGTWLSRLIKWYTKEPLNHASLAFDPGLREVYSFGRKDQRNPVIGGFVKEDVRGPLMSGSRCAVYRCSVDAETFMRIRNEVKRIEERHEEYAFNLLGIIAVGLGRGLSRRRAFFCSEFVSTVCRRAGFRLTDKSDSLVRPADLAASDKLTLVFQGEMTHYLRRMAAGDGRAGAARVRALHQDLLRADAAPVCRRACREGRLEASEAAL